MTKNAYLTYEELCFIYRIIADHVDRAKQDPDYIKAREDLAERLASLPACDGVTLVPRNPYTPHKKGKHHESSL